jgi:cytochrome P450
MMMTNDSAEVEFIRRLIREELAQWASVVPMFGPPFAKRLQLEEALDEYVNMRGPYLAPIYTQDQAAEARRRLLDMFDAVERERAEWAAQCDEMGRKLAEAVNSRVPR